MPREMIAKIARTERSLFMVVETDIPPGEFNYKLFDQAGDADGLKFFMDKIANFSKFLQGPFVSLLPVRRVRKRPVQADTVAGECGTGFCGIVADGDDVMKMLAQIFLDVLGMLSDDIDADLIHHLDSGFVDLGRLGPGAEYFELVGAVMPQDPFSHLGAARITSAKNKESCLHLFFRTSNKPTAINPPTI